MSYKVAVLIPCYNEELAIAQVIEKFRLHLPDADIYVYDNNSQDNTASVAKKAGAIVRTEPMQGKGNVVRRMFRDIDADIYLMTDGDLTYDAASAPALIEYLVNEEIDMVVGVREDTEKQSYRLGHRWGNKFFTGFVSTLFGKNFTDILSGYRVFSKRFVKSFPCLSNGFEIETELTVHALELQMPVGELSTPYFSRIDGSVSKLSTYRDGFIIAKMIVLLAKEIKPFLFFGVIALLLSCLSIGLALPILKDFLRTGLVLRFPTAFLSMGIMLLACFSFLAGVILDSVSRGRKEVKLLHYLQFNLPKP